MGQPVVVIGGGIVGAAIAHELQARGTETILIERDVEPQGASAYSFASLTAFDEVQHDAYLLKAHGLIAWRQWAKVYGDNLGVTFPGEIRWAESTEGDRFLTELFQRASGRGYPVRFVGGDEVKKLEPASAFTGHFPATFGWSDGQAEPVRAIGVFTDAFREHGGVLLIGRASVMIEEGSLMVRVGDDRVQASKVVLATGAETSALLERLGWDVPMDPSPGLLAVTTPIEHFLNRTVYVYPHGEVPIHLRQLRDGRVLIGERAQDEVAQNPTTDHAHMLLGQARKAFPILGRADLDHFTVEWRPMPRDRMPIVGGLPGLESLYVATAHSGVTIAPALARFVAEEVLDSAEVDHLKPFRPGRFAAHRVDAYRSVEEAFSGSDLYLG